jgi:hypothetical protein
MSLLLFPDDSPSPREIALCIYRRHCEEERIKPVPVISLCVREIATIGGRDGWPIIRHNRNLEH